MGLPFPCLPAVEQKHDEEAQKLSGSDRLALAAARPFTKKGGDVCQLRLAVGGAGRPVNTFGLGPSKHVKLPCLEARWQL